MGLFVGPRGHQRGRNGLDNTHAPVSNITRTSLFRRARLFPNHTRCAAIVIDRHIRCPPGDVIGGSYTPSVAIGGFEGRLAIAVAVPLSYITLGNAHARPVVGNECHRTRAPCGESKFAHVPKHNSIRPWGIVNVKNGSH